MQAASGLLSFSESSINKAQSLFKSEGYFWLTTAAAVSFAAEILSCDHDTQKHSQEILDLFNQSIRNNEISAAEMKRAQALVMEDLHQINQYNDRAVIFKPEHGVQLCRCFTTYWLFFKLIELEWQEILASEEMAETYQFMDMVIADGEELEEMEKKLLAGESLDEDSTIYLRNHWLQVRSFWHDLQQDLMLLQAGLMPYQPLLR